MSEGKAIMNDYECGEQCDCNVDGKKYIVEEILIGVLWDAHA